MGYADGGIKKAKVVVDFGDGADGGAGAAARRLLLDGDRRAQPFDGIDVRPLDLIQKLARIGGESFDVAALPLGIDGVKGEGRLSRAGESGDDRQGVAGNLNADVAQVVLTGTANGDLGDGHGRQR